MIYESEISIFNKDALKTKFGSIQTNFDVTLGKISAIISDSEIEEYISGHTTMNSKLSSTVQDLEGVHTQVSSMKTDYDSHFTSVESHLTTLDTTVSGISASVSTVSQEAIKTDTIYYLATSASSGVTRSTSGWTTTTQSVTAEKKYLWIYHKYTKGDDSTTYTDPVIAGVYGDTGTSFKWNLVRGTDALKSGDGLWTSGTWRTTGNAGTVAYNQDIADSPVASVTNGITITATTANSSIGITQDRCPIRKEQITQSVWVKGSAGDKVRLQPIWSDASGASESGSKDITLADGNWTHIEWTKTPNYAHDSVSLCYIVYLAKTAGTTLTVCCPKMEYGSPASEWCLAENEYRVDVGGRNILRDSERMTSWWKASRVTISDGVATLTGSSSDWNANLSTSKFDASVYDGNESVISFDYKSTANCTIRRVYASTSVDKDSTSWTRTRYIGANFTIPSSGGEWKRYVMSGAKISVASLTDGSGDVVSGFLQFYNRTNNAVFQMRHIQFEKGNNPSDWTPAPEDVSIAEIATLRYASDSTTAPSAPTSAVTSTATTTGVWTKATPILSGTYKYMYMCDQIKWENGLYTWTAVVRDSALEDLVERVTTAELKITDSAIISTVTETVNGKTALNSVIDQRADSIRLKADKISWSSTYSSMAEDGSLTVQSLTANNYIYVNGDKRTYFRLPLYPLQNSLESQETYFEISNGGMVVKTYSAESKPGVASTEYVTTTFSNSSSLSNRTKAIQISCSANESILEIGAFGFNSELKNGTKRYYTRFDWQGCSFEFYPSSDTEGHVKSTYSYNSCRIEGNLYATGTKNRVISTDDYSDRLLYCYETPSPLFGDIGEGEIGEDGKCYVWLDPVFSQTIRTSNYQVSLQSYSPSLTYVMERTGSYFIVGGEPGAKFGWEIKAKQADFAERRLDRFEEQREDDSVNYGLLASNHINELMEGRYAE